MRSRRKGGNTFVPVSNDAEIPTTIKEDGSVESVKVDIEKKYGVSGLPADSPAMRALQQLSEKPKKSILKKSNSYTIHSFGIPGLPSVAASEMRQRAQTATRTNPNTPYDTVTGAENRFKSALGNIQSMFKRPSQLTLRSPASPASPMNGGGKQKGFKMDMSLAEQREWEELEMEKTVNFNQLHIDPAPFQLVEKTSLLKVHSLFSMLGVNHAYVTAIGRLIGVVGLKELRKAIEDANSGHSMVAKERQQQENSSVNASSTHETTQLTVDSMDSAFSNGAAHSEDESDNELVRKA